MTFLNAYNFACSAFMTACFYEQSLTLMMHRRRQLFDNMQLCYRFRCLGKTRTDAWFADEQPNENRAAPLRKENRMKLTVAAVQTFSILGDTEANLKSVLQLTREAAENGANLIVFPECMNAGYVWDSPEHALDCADPIPGTMTRGLAQVTSEHGVFVAIGISEREDDKVYNSIALVGPDGLIGKYQKNFLFDFDPYWFAWGKTGYPVFDTPLGKIGMFICADARIPEGARALSLAGAEILLHITNSTTHEQHEMHVPTRGNENEAWFISADKAGRELGLTYPGNSLIIAPDGTVRAQGSFEGHEIIYADIDTDDVHAVRNGPNGLLKGRRPETYGILTKDYADLPIAKFEVEPVVPSQLAVLASALQVTNTGEDAKATLERAILMGDEAGKENTGLIVFPELFLCGANPSAEEARASAKLTGDVLEAFGKPARKWDACYILSLVEEEAGNLYITTYFIGPDGKARERYRKVHLTAEEAVWATPGDAYKVVQAPFGNVGLMSGHEVCYCEVSRILTCLGADVIATPSAWRLPRERDLFLKERALENKVYIVAANRLDAPIPGESRIVLPNAAIPTASKQGQDDFIFHYLNLVWARDKQIRPGTDLIKNRRTEFYGPLCDARPHIGPG